MLLHSVIIARNIEGGREGRGRETEGERNRGEGGVTDIVAIDKSVKLLGHIYSLHGT